MFDPNSLVGRLTATDNRLRGLLSQFGIPTIMLVRWNLDGVQTPQFKLRVTPLGTPKNKAALESAVNMNLEVSEQWLLISDIPRQLNRKALDTNILRYGMVELSELNTPAIVKQRCEVQFLDTAKLTTYSAQVKPFLNR